MTDWLEFGMTFRNDALVENMGQSVTYTPASGSAVTVIATVTAGDPQSQAPGIYLVFGCRASDFTVLPIRGGAITWKSTTYRIRDVDSDLYGFLRLSVEKT